MEYIHNMPQLAAFVLFRENFHPLCSPVTPGDTSTLYSSTLDLSLNFTLISTGHSHLLLPTFSCIKYWKFFTICFKGNSHFSSPKSFVSTPLFHKSFCRPMLRHLRFLSLQFSPSKHKLYLDNVRMTSLSLYGSHKTSVFKNQWNFTSILIYLYIYMYISVYLYIIATYWMEEYRN